MSIESRRLSYALGAEVIGVDLTRPVDAATFRAINAIFLEHHVVLFRGQSITRSQHVAFARHFGDSLFVVPQRFHDPDEDPELAKVLSIVRNQPAAGGVIGGIWHSDLSELPRPAAASLLRCVTLPDVGGDTMFANMHRAYATLSSGMQDLLSGLYGVYLGGEPDFDLSTTEAYWESRQANPAAAQPVVRIHAESGETTLYVNAETHHFVGMTDGESKPLIEYLTAWATRPENVYRHQWQENDLVIWDNRSVLHMALSDYQRGDDGGTKRRHMERVTAMGDESGHEYLGPIGSWPAAERPATLR